jgi:tetratricopeptide (TPR) repeat protein
VKATLGIELCHCVVRSGVRALTAILVLGIAAGHAWAGAREDAFLGRLARHIAELPAIPEDAREVARKALADANADSDAESLRLEVLTLISPALRAALDAFDNDDYAASLAALEPLQAADDPFVRAAARSYAARALVQLGRLVEAEERIAALLAEGPAELENGLDEVELRYMLGYCQVQNLKQDEARQTLSQFLRDYPDAPQRLAVTARQMLGELDRQIPESIGEVADLMNFSAKRLKVDDPSQPVRDAQDRAVALLDKLIEKTEQAEEQQQQMAQNTPQQSPQQSPQQQQQQQQNPNNPAQQSTAPPGDPNAANRRTGRTVSPGEAWGALPDAQREQILQVLKERFPGRYRALVEQYYQSLAEEP